MCSTVCPPWQEKKRFSYKGEDEIYCIPVLSLGAIEKGLSALHSPVGYVCNKHTEPSLLQADQPQLSQPVLLWRAGVCILPWPPGGVNQQLFFLPLGKCMNSVSFLRMKIVNTLGSYFRIWVLIFCGIIIDFIQTLPNTYFIHEMKRKQEIKLSHTHSLCIKVANFLSAKILVSNIRVQFLAALQ